MKPLFKELQAVDRCIIRIATSISEKDRQSLSLLYTPIIGQKATSLYYSFWADAEMNNDNWATHYYVMAMSGLSLGEFFEARITLEAIGLLKTTKIDNENQRSFIYELISPLTGNAFFHEPVLATTLFRAVDEVVYRKLREYFQVKIVESFEGQDVSRSFQDVFSNDLQLEKYGHLIENDVLKVQQKAALPFSTNEFDFDLLFSGLKKQMISTQHFSLKQREYIAKVAFLYKFNAIDMQKIVPLCLDENNQLNEEMLMKHASDFYKMTVSSTAPKVRPVVSRNEPTSQQNAEQSKEQQLIAYLESTPPVDVLRDLSNGKEPIPVDVELANSLVATYGFSPGVVNVLLQFVLLKAQKKLNRNYVHKIAAHWQRENILTVKQAIDISRKEHDQYLAWRNQLKEEPKSSKPRYNNKKQGKTETVPDWFYKAKEQREKNEPSSQDGVTDDYVEKRRQLMAKLGIKEGQEK